MTGENYVIDCSGKKVFVGEKLFAAKCWVGNTSDFLKSNAEYVISEALRWEPLPRYFIAVPIYRSGLGFLSTIESLLDQGLPDNSEIVLYINQPEGALEEETILTLNWVTDVFPETFRCNESGTGRGSIPAKHTEKWKNLESLKNPRVRVLFEKIEGNTPVIYRRLYTTLVQRIVLHVEKMQLNSKEKKVKEIEKLMTRTVFCTVDDDILFKDNSSFSQGLARVTAGKSMLLGKVSVSEVKSSYPELDDILTDLMNVFFKIKYEQGTAILSPKAAASADLFHIPPPEIEQKYGDQVWLASACVGKEKIFIDVDTTIYEETYPSNAEMNLRLARYIKTGEGEDAIEIFKNILPPDSGCDVDKKGYSKEAIQNLISALKERDLIGIQSEIKKIFQQK